MPHTNWIQAPDLEHETGLSKDLLRKWRSRYGFPIPEMREDGVLAYTREQVRQLRLIRRLQDAGFQPAQLVGKPLAQLELLLGAVSAEPEVTPWSPIIQKLIALLQQDELESMGKILRRELAQQGLTGFVQLTLAPLMDALAEAWAKQTLHLYQEHLCTALLMGLLSDAISATKPKTGYPRVAFATPPAEQHVMGLQMIHAVLADQGCRCISLGPPMPISELELAIRAIRADLVCISFSCAYPERRIRPFLLDLSTRLDDRPLWVGGAGAAQIKRPPANIRVFSDLITPIQALREHCK